MSVQDNIDLLSRWFQEVWNEGKTQTVHELLSPDAVAIGQAGSEVELRGPQEFARFVEQIRAAFPDIKVKMEDAFGAEDKVVLRWSARMTPQGDTLGIPATGKPVRLTGITIARIVDGKIVAGWDNWDQLGMLQQIGAYGQRGDVALGKPA
jgi:steroid delta-isomerase-like uncharacterized protein